MEIPREDLERLMAIEQTRELAMAEYRRNPNDAEVRKAPRLCPVLSCRHLTSSFHCMACLRSFPP